MEGELNEYVYSQCLEQLVLIRENVTKKMANGFYKVEAKAYMKMVNRLFELAAAAAVTNRMRLRHGDAIVSVSQDIEDTLFWNLKTA